MISSSFPFSKDVAAEALRDSETPAFVLYSIITAAYGPMLVPAEFDEDGDAYMDPIELWLALQSDFGVTVEEPVENRINAIRTAVETDAFFTDPVAFAACVMGMVHGAIDDIITGSLEDLSAADIMIALFDVQAIREPLEMSPAVLGVINEELLEEAEEDEADETVQSVVDEHKASVQRWLIRLGADPQVVAGF